MSLSDDQFSEIIHIPGRGQPVRMLSPEALTGLEGRRVRVHGHSPAKEHLGYPVYSIIVSGRVAGQATNVHLSDVRPYVHQRLLREAQEKGRKTANTFIVGTVVPTPTVLPSTPASIRPGQIRDASTHEDLSSGVSQVWMGPDGVRYSR